MKSKNAVVKFRRKRKGNNNLITLRTDPAEKKRRFSKGPAKKGEVRNPEGRPVGATNKPKLPDYRVIKEGMLNCFMKSKAPGIIVAMLDFKLPPAFGVLYTNKKIKKREFLYLLNRMERNFKWAVEFVGRLVPKESFSFGKMKHEFSLSSMTKRALTQPKSSKVIDLVKKQTEAGLTQFRTEVDSEGNEIKRDESLTSTQEHMIEGNQEMVANDSEDSEDEGSEKSDESDV